MPTLGQHFRTGIKIILYVTIIIAGYITVFKDRSPFHALDASFEKPTSRNSMARPAK